MRRNKKLEIKFTAVEEEGRCLKAEDGGQRKMLRNRANCGELVQLHGCYYARAEYWNALTAGEQYRHIIRSHAAVHPDWVFCGMTAAAVHGLEVTAMTARSAQSLGSVPWPLDHVHVATTRRGHGKSCGLVKRHCLRNVRCRVIDKVKVTSLRQTLFDCARLHELQESLPIVQFALRQGLITRASLATVFGTFSGRSREQALTVLLHAL
ncbi:MAG: hypothetical protein LKF99_00525 [Bifidobacterium sp.]|jgi:hypothetical protein|nr:hypothetical protein [Bifidobacterium sp.]